MAQLAGEGGGLFTIAAQQGIEAATRTDHPCGGEALPLIGFEVTTKMGVPAQLIDVHSDLFIFVG
jgi:hypothetical protein